MTIATCLRCENSSRKTQRRWIVERDLYNDEELRLWSFNDQGNISNIKSCDIKC